MADTNTPQIEVTPATGTPEYKAPATQEELDRIIESRLNRERAKYPNYEEYKAKAAEFAKLEEANKSELQKWQERAVSAEAKATSLEQERQLREWAAEVSEATKVPVSILKGNTYEELMEHALKIKEAIPMHPSGGEKGEVSPPSLSKEEILSIKDRQEREAAIAANPDLFNKRKE